MFQKATGSCFLIIGRKKEPVDEFEDEEIIAMLTNLNIPFTYIFNCKETIESGNYLFINKDIFKEERLRLLVLQEIKNIEGKCKLLGDGNLRINGF